MEEKAAKRRIALIDTSAKMGGVEFSTLYLAQQIDDNIFEYVVFCPEYGPLVEHCRDVGVCVEIVSLYKLWPTSMEFGVRKIPNPLAWIMNLISLIFSAVRYAVALKRLNIDLVCTKGLFAHFYGALAGKLCGLPVVIHMQDLLSQGRFRLNVLFMGLFARLFSNHVIADGTPIKSQFDPYLGDDRISYIRNGVDTDKFNPKVDGTQVRQGWRVASDEILIGNVARITRWKGQDYLVEAFAEIASLYPLAKLVLVGAPVFATNAFEQKLVDLIQNKGLQDRVIMAGFRYDLPEVLAAIDIFVYTAIEKDTSPLSVVSAMANGKAIITTDVEGISELFQGEDAILVPPKDAHALAVAISSLIESPGTRNQLSINVRNAAENNLGLRAFAEQCEAVFAKVVSRS